ncbi:hypothetical protein LEP1GSC195_2925 [Leptospira wolbachii serovar Codice str. CDC]|uniref:Uncharacterized protein n=1 Tax=Leptospira wolbachii serovar Codice str. CDC TaxID=1218599 RepID=R9A7B6_9LEPT|nr:hypothetical protein LEP1GSC195_2925 [Leptospira wolbachii serovar Codice str. CDC]
MFYHPKSRRFCILYLENKIHITKSQSAENREWLYQSISF